MKRVSPSLNFVRRIKKASDLLTPATAKLSSFFQKAKRLAFKALLLRMGVTISAVVPNASHRPRMFVLLSVGRWSHRGFM